MVGLERRHWLLRHVAVALCFLTPALAGSATSCSTSIGPWGTLAADADNGQPVLPNIFDSSAKNAQNVCPGYKASSLKNNSLGIAATLTLAGDACNVYGDDVESLQLTVEYQSADRIHVEIAPTYIGKNNESWFVPSANIMAAASVDSNASSSVSMNDLQFTWGNEPSFWMKVTRKSNSDILFDTSNTKLVFENQFVEFVTAMPEEYNLYGLGETIHALRLGNNFTKTMWNSDNGDTPDRNLYGTHPVYYDTRYFENDKYVPWTQANSGGTYSSMTHAVYYRNAHAHEILLQPDNITWRTLGGNIDLYFYSGPSVSEAAMQYQTSTIGLPAMQQYWTFGYHQCRWGYNNWSETEAVVRNMETFKIPLEVQWNDIDWMYQVRDFVSDPERFPVAEGLAFLQRLHEGGRRYVHIVDSAIYIPNPDNCSDAYGTYTRGNELDAFLLNPDGSQYIGSVWPGFTVFPDWLANGTQDWWSLEIFLNHHNVTFDGIWIDMSEVSSFCVGSCGSVNLTQNPVGGRFTATLPTGYPEAFGVNNQSQASAASSYAASVAANNAPASTTSNFLISTPTPGTRNINYPPYAINNIFYDLAVHGASPNATHQDELQTQEYDVHNLWGFGILRATYNALLTTFPGKRPFIIGRSTFAGAGTVAGHWGGDNYSQWRYMYWAIPQALSMSLFGIPMFGPDTCGFNDNTDEELCNRWMQLSAFFTFYRNHNTLGAISQEPYVWSSVIEASKTAMNIRYSILPYIYTLFYQAHTTGSTIHRAMAWEFPNEPALAAADRQFMLGPSLLITPVLEPLADAVNGVFPGSSTKTIWYDWYNQTAITNEAAKSGQNVTIDAPLGHIPVYVRGGSVLPMQPLQDALVIRDVQTHDWTLLVALDANSEASGSLYLDDGENIRQSATLEVDLSVSNGCLSATPTGGYKNSNPLANVTVMGVDSKPSSVKLGDTSVGGVSYSQDTKALEVSGLSTMTSDGAWIKQWKLCWS